MESFIIIQIAADDLQSVIMRAGDEQAFDYTIDLLNRSLEVG